MSEKKENKLLHGLKAAGHAIKKSPQMARKKIASAVQRKKMGGGKDYSELASCRENGWLHDDDAIRVGVNFHVKYVGSMEIQYIPSDPHANNELAIRTMRQVKHLAQHHEKLILNISSTKVTLLREDTKEVVMRHATSRIAYSTVDHKHPVLFAYVALPKNSKSSLCHVFDTKSAKKSYELTFTCAQAFDTNYKDWQASSAKAKEAAAAARQADPAAAALGGLHRVDAPAASVDQAAARIAELPLGADGPEEAAAEGGGEGEGEGYLTIEALEIEDEVSMAAAADEYFGQLKDAKSMPNLLDIGVSPNDYNQASEEPEAE